MTSILKVNDWDSCALDLCPHSFLVSGCSKSGKYKDGGQSPGNDSHQKFGDYSQVTSI